MSRDQEAGPSALPGAVPVSQPQAEATARLLRRIGATFAAPRRLPGLLAPGLPWLDVLLITTTVAVLSVLVAPDEVFVEPMREAVTRRGEPVEILSAPDVVARWGRAMGMMATLATHPVVLFVLAAALTLVFGIFYRGPATFRDFLSLASHAMLIPALGTLLSVTVRLAMGGPGALLDVEAASLPMAVLLAIDPFVVWMLIVLGLAAQRLDPRRSAAASASLLVIAYVVLVSTSAALLHRDLLALG